MTFQTVSKAQTSASSAHLIHCLLTGVGQEQNFIAVNPAYRLGGLGFFASEELTAEGESANAGLLDSRMAYDWVRENIAEFVSLHRSSGLITDPSVRSYREATQTISQSWDR